MTGPARPVPVCRGPFDEACAAPGFRGGIPTRPVPAANSGARPLPASPDRKPRTGPSAAAEDLSGSSPS